MKVHYYTCDVFTDKRFGGNQLAVFPDAAKIPEGVLQSITREFNFSETTFVYPPAKPSNTRKVRIFTPGSEIPFAGHPTVGTAFVLAKTGAIALTGDETKIVFEEGVGPVPVSIIVKSGQPSFAQLTAAKPAEMIDAQLNVKQIAAFLGLEEEEIDTKNYPMQYVSVGLPFLFVPIKELASMKKIKVNVQKMEEALRHAQSKDVYVFTPQCEQSDSQFHVRMFAPLQGIAEDPATGSAAAAFGGYLSALDTTNNGMLKWKIEQGFEIGRPSLLYIETEKKNGETISIRVGGNSVMVCEGEMDV